jgi:hypothetical protein
VDDVNTLPVSEQASVHGMHRHRYQFSGNWSSRNTLNTPVNHVHSISEERQQADFLRIIYPGFIQEAGIALSV